MKLNGLILKPDSGKFLYDGKRTYMSVRIPNTKVISIYSEVDHWIEPNLFSSLELKYEYEKLLAQRYTIRQEIILKNDTTTQEYIEYCNFKQKCKEQAKLLLSSKYDDKVDITN